MILRTPKTHCRPQWSPTWEPQPLTFLVGGHKLCSRLAEPFLPRVEQLTNLEYFWKSKPAASTRSPWIKKEAAGGSRLTGEALHRLKSL